MNVLRSMKIYERINEIKGTSATVDEIHNWMVMNKICPLDVAEELETGEQPELQAIADKRCADNGDGSCYACYRKFLEMEVAK